MPHALTELNLDAVAKPPAETVHEVSADVCVVGAGIAGSSAAIESARLGRSVVLVDALPLIGGQMVHSLIGLFCGVFGNAPRYTQLTHGVFDDIFRELGPSGDLHFSRGHTTTVFYNEVALGRWLERTVRDLGIQVVTGAVLQDVAMNDGRVAAVTWPPGTGTSASGRRATSTPAATRRSPGRRACPAGYPSAPSTAASRSSSRTSTRTTSRKPGEMDAVFAARGEEFGLLRRGGLAFFFPGRGTAVLNVTHIDAPLDPLDASRAMFEGREQADRAISAAARRVPQGVRRRPACGPTASPAAARPGGSRAPTS